MDPDPIVQEVRQWRDQLAERFNYDLDALCRYLREEQEKSGRKVVVLPPRRVNPPLGTSPREARAGRPSYGGGAFSEEAMPEVSRFFGISIRMYFDDHEPSHLHAIYGDAEVEVGVDPITLLRGRFPRRALGMVLEWAALHQQELLENWDRLHNEQPATRIDPLE